MIIGLTGGIASGKSTAAAHLASKGARVMDGDVLGHRAYEPETAAFARIAETFGADVVGAEDLMEQIQGGNINFDKVIATPDMMPLVGRLGKILGPRGMMPNPKVGTVTMDVTKAVGASKGGAVEFRVEKAGIVHAGVGKASFTEAQLVENVRALIGAIVKSKPSGAKGTYIRRIALSSTMGPGVKIDTSEASAA